MHFLTDDHQKKTMADSITLCISAAPPSDAVDMDVTLSTLDLDLPFSTTNTYESDSSGIED